MAFWTQGNEQTVVQLEDEHRVVELMDYFSVMSNVSFCGLQVPASD